jgi:hypothetical protein
MSNRLATTPTRAHPNSKARAHPRQQRVIAVGGHTLKRFAPALAGPSRRPNHDLRATHFNLNVIAQPRLVEEHLRDSNPSRVADLHQTGLHNYIAITSSRLVNGRSKRRSLLNFLQV